MNQLQEKIAKIKKISIIFCLTIGKIMKKLLIIIYHSKDLQILNNN